MLIAKLFPGHVYRGYLMAGQIPRNDDKFAPRIFFLTKQLYKKYFEVERNKCDLHF